MQLPLSGALWAKLNHLPCSWSPDLERQSMVGKSLYIQLFCHVYDCIITHVSIAINSREFIMGHSLFSYILSIYVTQAWGAKSLSGAILLLTWQFCEKGAYFVGDTPFFRGAYLARKVYPSNNDRGEPGFIHTFVLLSSSTQNGWRRCICYSWA